MAGKTIPFRLITPVAVAFEGDAELVIAVGTEGEEGILPSHAPFLTALRPGILRANVATGGESKRLEFATSEGFLQALPDRVVVLVDAALQRDAIDIAAARADLETAKLPDGSSALRPMPKFQFDEEDATAIVAYFRSLK
jgi:F-type H+-transporting ATPase subunit epsilon